MKIQITQDQIKRGVRKSGFADPIALSVRTKMHLRSDQIYVDGYFVDVELKGGKRLSFSLPKVAERFVRDWDAGGDVEPIEFVMTKVEGERV